MPVFITSNTRKNSYLTVTDLFCGAGGSSQGARRAGMEVKLAANHLKINIESHAANFPDVDHRCTNLDAADPRDYPRTTILIGSPSCDYHSPARGEARPVNYELQPSLWEDEMQANNEAAERSRFTMFDMVNFTRHHQYEIIVVENVVEVCKWQHYQRWLLEMSQIGEGYSYQEIFFNSMFAWPTPQSRDRFYCVFWKKNNRAPNLEFRPKAWCSTPGCERDVEAVQAWKKPGNKWGKYGANGQYWYRCPACAKIVQPYYYCAANAIDWSNKAERIGDRKRPLKPKTLERIKFGLRKFSQNPCALAPFLTLPNDRAKPGQGIPRDVYAPFYTQTGSDRMALTTPPSPSPFLLETGYTHAANDRTRSQLDPLATQTGRQSVGLAIPPAFIVMQREHTSANSVSSALNTVTGGNHHALISMPPSFLTDFYSGSNHNHDITNPMSTITSIDHHALITLEQQAAFITSYYGGSNLNQSISEAIGTVTGKARHALVQPPFIHSYYGRDDAVSPVSGPMPTVRGDPCHSLVQPDIDVMDCGFRMLTPEEVKLAMAFDPKYKILGTQAQKVKQAGQAVTPPVMEMILARCAATLG